jgi:dTDP-4-amino-4,6-dideoxygalactose transaminase
VTKIDLSSPLPLPEAMVNLSQVAAGGDKITIGEGHLERQYLEIAEEVTAAIAAVLPSGKYTLGPNLHRFEQEFAAYCDSMYSIGISSGTEALHLALAAMDVGPGDEVITVCNTYIATALAVTYTGATPVFVDVDPRDSGRHPERQAQTA